MGRIPHWPWYLILISLLLFHLPVQGRKNIGPLNELKTAMALCESRLNYPECYASMLKINLKAPPTSDSLIQALVLFFEVSHDVMDFQGSLKQYLGGWRQLFSGLNKVKPNHPTLQTLRMNLAVYFTRLGKPDSALQQYSVILDSFPGNSRYGSEALFFSAQIHYQRAEYKTALENYLKIKTISFLPVSSEEWNQRLSECRFRLVEASIKKGDFEKGEAEMKKILASSVSGKFRDSLLFHYSEIKMVKGDTQKTCSLLDEISHRKVIHDITYSAIYNMFLFSCPELTSPMQDGHKYSLLAASYLDSDQEISRKKYILLRRADYLLEAQDKEELQRILHPSQLKQFEQTIIKDLLVFLFRNSERADFQYTLMQWTLNKSEKEFKGDKVISEVLALYREYFNFKQGNHFSIKNIPGQGFHWERQIHLFLKGAWFARLSKKEPKLYAAHIDSVQYYFTLLGRQNTEMAFSAAKELASFYSWIIDSMEDSTSDPYRNIGQTMIQIKFAVKIKTLASRTDSWRSRLKEVPLDKSSLNLEFKNKEWEKIPGYWNKISAAVNTISTQPTTRRKEAAHELMYSKLLSLYEYEKQYRRQSVTAIISTGLFWASMSIKDSNVTDKFDHQALAADRIYALLQSLEHNQDTLYLARLGEVFQNSLDTSESADCYFVTGQSGVMQCLPRADNLPGVNAAQANLLVTERAVGPHQGFLIRENLANYRILCEKHKIRKLKSRLMNL